MSLIYIDPGTGFTITSLGGLLIAVIAAFLGVISLFFKRILGFLRKSRPLKGIILLFVLILTIIITGVIMGKRTSNFNRKVIILGIDALSPQIVEPMMEQDKLPNLSKIAEVGSYRRLETTNPAQSPVAWAGFATGQNPGKNGIFDFIERDPRTYGLKLSLSCIEKTRAKRVVRAKSFWQYTSEKRVPTIILSCPVTFPPDKIYGRMLSGMGVPDILGTEGTFTFYTTERLDKDADIGGKVFEAERSFPKTLHLIGPKMAGPDGKAENRKVPFKVLKAEDQDSVLIEYQNKTLELKAGDWSEWQTVSFKAGIFKKIDGIFKFYLVETEPEFKLYISPINFDPRNPYFPISHPRVYSKELAEKTGLYHTQGMPIDTWSVNEKRLTEKPLLEQIDEVLKERSRILDLELNRFDKGLLFCYFEPVDIIQHMFWRYIDPQHPLYDEDAPQEYRKMIEAWYIKMDGIVGDVLERLKEEDTLIILSDHGFNTFRRAAHINSWLRKEGYLELQNPQAPSGSELLIDIDWSKTKAYSIGFGAIYVNQRGREQQGIVEPGKDTEALKKEISERLKNWRDDKYDWPVISNIYEREEIFRGKHAGQTPDLYIGFNTGFRASWQTAIGGVPEGLIEDNLKKWSGSHLFDPRLVPGIILSNKKISRSNPSIYDIAPTILKITGYTQEEIAALDMDGVSLFD